MSASDGGEGVGHSYAGDERVTSGCELEERIFNALGFDDEGEGAGSSSCLRNGVCSVSGAGADDERR